jgi:Protein of unknown function (DUF4245)
MQENGQQGQPSGEPSDGRSPVTAPVSPAIERLQRFTAANMVRSLLPLVLGCLLVVGVMALRQDPEDPIREVDTSSAERATAEVAGYQLLVPQGLSAAWRPTSVRTNAGQAKAGDRVTLQIGWYTPAKEFAEYVVSDDPAAPALTDVLTKATADGPEQVSGNTWQRLTTERGEKALTRTEGTATLLVTGSAPDQELQTLIGSLQPYAP